MIYVDTSGLISALFPDQPDHEACAEVLRNAQPPLVMSPFVLAEVDYLIMKYGGIKAELAFLEEVGRGAYHIPTIDSGDVHGIYTIAAKYRSLKVGVADASIVYLAERFEGRDLVTLDRRRFSAVRAGRKKFRILP